MYINYMMNEYNTKMEYEKVVPKLIHEVKYYTLISYQPQNKIRQQITVDGVNKTQYLNLMKTSTFYNDNDPGDKHIFCFRWFADENKWYKMNDDNAAKFLKRLTWDKSFKNRKTSFKEITEDEAMILCI